MNRLRSALAWLVLIVGLLFVAAPIADAQVSSMIPTEAWEAPAEEQTGSAPLEFWGRKILVFRTSFERVGPKERASQAAERISAIPNAAEHDIRLEPATIGEYTGFVVLVNDRSMFGVLEGDLDRESGLTLEETAQEASDRLAAVLQARYAQSDLDRLLPAIGWSVGATVAFALLLVLLSKLAKKILDRLMAKAGRKAWRLRLGGVDLFPAMRALRNTGLRLAFLVAGIALSYFWLTFVFGRFPYTQPWSEGLRDYLVDLVLLVVFGVLDGLPGLFTVIVIFMVTRGASRVISGFFRGIQSGSVQSEWLAPEAVKVTHRLISIFLWIFALVLAYPFIPGSDTAAFRGVSVLFGLMISLGSAGLVNQIMSGLVVIYSRIFKPGDFIEFGDEEGVVKDVGFLSSKIITRRNEEVTIPNAVLTSAATRNITRLSEEATGTWSSTSVGIGYDTPWRQVEGMLLSAAANVPEIPADPEPRILIESLGDFAITYTLLFRLAEPSSRPMLLSNLHREVLDVFNENGVQIMSPHFNTQPSENIFTPKERWFEPPLREETKKPG